MVSTAIGVSLDLITPAAAAFVAASSGPHLPRRRSHLSALGRDVRAGVIGHRTLIRLISLVLAVSTVSCTSVSDGPTAMTSAPRATSASPARDPMLQPFASTSIWNMPIGDEAQLVPAHLAASKQIGNFAEEEVIVLEPNAPMVDLLESHADWNPALDRCVPQPGDIVVDRVPIPSGFVTDPKLGTTDDNAAAILRPDGRTLHQSQPVVRCSNGTATTHYRFDDADI